MAITDHLEHSPVGNPSIPRKTRCDRFNIKNAKRINADETCQYMSVWNLNKNIYRSIKVHTQREDILRINDKHGLGGRGITYFEKGQNKGGAPLKRTDEQNCIWARNAVDSKFRTNGLQCLDTNNLFGGSVLQLQTRR